MEYICNGMFEFIIYFRDDKGLASTFKADINEKSVKNYHLT